MQTRTWRSGRFWLILLALLWLGAVGMGHVTLWNYAATPGRAGEAPSQWPTESALARANRGLTLLLFAHPKCPCTGASIEELARIMAQCGDRLTAYVLFYKPAATSSEWEQTPLWYAAQRIPGVQVRTDVDHGEASRFAVETSGDVLLYDAAGRLVFHGGITGARGHAGDNVGHGAVVALATTGVSRTRQTCVFGCPIRETKDLNGD